MSNGNEMGIVNISILQQNLFGIVEMYQDASMQTTKIVFQEGVDICKCLVEKRVKLLQRIHIKCTGVSTVEVKLYPIILKNVMGLKST